MTERSFDLQEALEYLDISQGTFFVRIRELGIRPIDYNPALKRQKKPRYRKSDLDKIKQGLFCAA